MRFGNRLITGGVRKPVTPGDEDYDTVDQRQNRQQRRNCFLLFIQIRDQSTIKHEKKTLYSGMLVTVLSSLTTSSQFGGSSLLTSEQEGGGEFIVDLKTFSQSVSQQLLVGRCVLDKDKVRNKIHLQLSLRPFLLVADIPTYLHLHHQAIINQEDKGISLCQKH